MSDDSDNDLADLHLMVGSQIAFTNVPRNMLIVSLLISIIGISMISTWALSESNSDWEPVEAQILDTGVTDYWCSGEGFFDECEYDGHFPTVEFSWEIDGENFQSDDYILYPPNLSSDSKAEQWLEERGIITGAIVTGYVNPNDNSEAVLLKQNWFDILLKSGYIFCGLPFLLCSILPIFLFLSARRFESYIPKERRKRYKLQRVSHNSWITPIEATELQSEARSAWLKEKLGSLSEVDSAFEELSRLSEALDSINDQTPLEKTNYTLLLDGKKEIEIHASNQGELLGKINDIDRDWIIIYLEDSKSKGRKLEINFLGSRGDGDYLRIRELIADEEIRTEEINVEKNYERIYSFIKEALDNANNNDDWWNES